MTNPTHFHDFKPCRPVQFPTREQSRDWSASAWDSLEDSLLDLVRNPNTKADFDTAPFFRLLPGQVMRPDHDAA